MPNTIREGTPILHHTSSNTHTHEQDDNYVVTSIWSRWQSFASVCFYVSIAGTTYAYGVYSQLLKENLGFSQDGLDIVASVGNTGLYLSLIAGFFLEAYGLRIVVVSAGFLIFIGFLYIYLAVKLLVPADIVSISFFFFLSQFGVCCHVSSAVTFCVRLFPKESRGAAVGLGKGYFGLSSAVLGDFATGLFKHSTASFLLFIALVIPSVGAIGCSLANLVPKEVLSFKYDRNKDIKTSLKPFFIHFSLLFIILFIVSLSQYVLNVSSSVNTVLSIVLAIAIVSIQMIPSFYGSRIIDVEVKEDEENDTLLRPTGDDDDATTGGSSSDNKDTGGKQIDEKEDNKRDNYVTFGFADEMPADSVTNGKEDECYYGEPIPIGKSVCTWRFWVLYAVYLIICGCGLMVIDNINAIAEAVGKNPSSFFVALVSLANGCGRVIAGVVSDKLIHVATKLQLLSLVCMCMCIAHALFAIGSVYVLYPCLISVGFLFGCSVSLMAVNVADIFGSRYVATNFGAVDSAPIFGSYLFVTAIVSMFYKTNYLYDDGTSTCISSACFRWPFIINSLFCFLAMVLCLYLDRQTLLPTNKR